VLRRDLDIQDLGPAAVPWAADLHRRALPPGFFPRLGPAFLRAYYRTFADSPAAVALCAVTDGRPAGVLVGTLDNAAHHAWVLRSRGPELALRGAAGLLAHPPVLAEFLRTRALRYARGVTRRGAGGGGAPAERVAVLTHLAVEPRARRGGLGAALTRAFTAAAAEASADVAALVTLAGPGGAGPFYERLGWNAVATRDRDGRHMTEYRLPLHG